MKHEFKYVPGERYYYLREVDWCIIDGYIYEAVLKWKDGTLENIYRFHNDLITDKPVYRKEKEVFETKEAAECYVKVLAMIKIGEHKTRIQELIKRYELDTMEE